MLYGRFRKREKQGDFLPVLIPVMNLFLLMLPFLLETAILQKLTTIEMQLPSISEVQAGGSGGTSDAAAANAQIIIDLKRETLSVYIDADKYAEMPSATAFEDTLSAKLKEIKKRFPNKRDVILKVETHVVYEKVVMVMDVCKTDDLFPDVVYLDEVK